MSLAETADATVPIRLIASTKLDLKYNMTEHGGGADHIIECDGGLCANGYADLTHLSVHFDFS